MEDKYCILTIEQFNIITNSLVNIPYMQAFKAMDIIRNIKLKSKEEIINELSK